MHGYGRRHSRTLLESPWSVKLLLPPTIRVLLIPRVQFTSGYSDIANNVHGKAPLHTQTYNPGKHAGSVRASVSCNQSQACRCPSTNCTETVVLVHVHAAALTVAFGPPPAGPCHGRGICRFSVPAETWQIPAGEAVAAGRTEGPHKGQVHALPGRSSPIPGAHIVLLSVDIQAV